MVKHPLIVILKNDIGQEEERAEYLKAYERVELELLRLGKIVSVMRRSLVPKAGGSENLTQGLFNEMIKYGQEFYFPDFGSDRVAEGRLCLCARTKGRPTFTYSIYGKIKKIK